MTTLHRIGEGLFDRLYRAIADHQHWIAFKREPYFLTREDIHCFSSRAAGRLLVKQDKGYILIYATSILSLYRQIESGYAVGLVPIQINANYMNPTNLEYLKDNLKFMG